MLSSQPAPKALRLVHGDCVEGLKRIPSNSVRLVIADPPYAIGVKGAKWDAVSIRDNYMSWAKSWLVECKRVLIPGGAFLLYGSPVINLVARISVMLEDELGLNLVQHLNWVYTQGGDARMSSMVQYAVRHELLSWFEKPGESCFNPEEVAEHYGMILVCESEDEGYLWLFDGGDYHDKTATNLLIGHQGATPMTHV